MTKYSKRSTKTGTSSNVEFNPDYSIIKRDLGRIAMLAGLFFAILIALSFYLK